MEDKLTKSEHITKLMAYVILKVCFPSKYYEIRKIIFSDKTFGINKGTTINDIVSDLNIQDKFCRILEYYISDNGYCQDTGASIDKLVSNGIHFNILEESKKINNNKNIASNLISNLNNINNAINSSNDIFLEAYKDTFVKGVYYLSLLDEKKGTLNIYLDQINRFKNINKKSEKYKKYISSIYYFNSRFYDNFKGSFLCLLIIALNFLFFFLAKSSTIFQFILATLGGLYIALLIFIILNSIKDILYHRPYKLLFSSMIFIRKKSIILPSKLISVIPTPNLVRIFFDLYKFFSKKGETYISEEEMQFDSIKLFLTNLTEKEKKHIIKPVRISKCSQQKIELVTSSIPREQIINNLWLESDEKELEKLQKQIRDRNKLSGVAYLGNINLKNKITAFDNILPVFPLKYIGKKKIWSILDSQDHNLYYDTLSNDHIYNNLCGPDINHIWAITPVNNVSA